MNKQTIILLLIFGLLLIPVGDTLKTYALEKYTRLSTEGCVAYSVAYLDTQKTDPATPPTPKPVQTSCNACKGTKRVLSGDKLISLPCPCGDNCKCQPSKSEPEMVKLDRSILLFTAKNWCKPCISIDTHVLPELEAMKWTVSHGLAENKHIQVIDYDTNQDLVEKYDIQLVPTFILLENGVETNRFVGYLNGWGVGNFWNKKPLTSDDTKEIFSTKQTKNKKN